MKKYCSYHLLPIITSIILIIIALNDGKVLGYSIIKADFNENSKPSQTLKIVKQLNLDPKQGLSMDNWGGIIRYKLDYPVFIDDRADFYGSNFYNPVRKNYTNSSWLAELTQEIQYSLGLVTQK